MSKRTRELADKYAHGELPEQERAPGFIWCKMCRTRLGNQSNSKDAPLTRDCPKCNGRGVLKR